MKLLAILLLVAPAIAFSQNYNVNAIPDSLKQNAVAVKRFEELKVTIQSASKARVKLTYATTVLSEAGEEFAAYQSSYTKLYSLEDVTGKLYDANGKLLKTAKKKDFTDMTYDDEMSLVTDNRLKRHSFYQKQYPFTIEYEEEWEIDGLFFLPKWQPVEDEKYAVQQSRFIVESPADYNFRFKQFNYAGQPVTKENGKTKSVTWEVTNIKPYKYEYYQPNFSEVTCNVFIAPAEFEIGGYKGNMNSWQGLGKFIAELNNGRDELPENVKQEVHKLVDGVSNKQEKIKLLYEYLQKNTRYISIQIGIGSWQPFDAKYVASKRYGDCKALSNYMKSLLKEAGITSNYVLVNSGDGRKGLWEDFPAPYFNHAIMAVPDGKDTTWLECTSSTNSAGYMGSNTGNRKALMIKDDGGVIVNTPLYKTSDNLQLRKIEATVDDKGNLTADVYTKFTGIQQELQHSLIYDANKEQRDKYLNNALSLPTYAIEKNNYHETKGKVPVIDEHLRITSPNYASISGKRLFIVPNLFNRASAKLPTEEPRKFDIEFTYAYRDIDTIHINIPSGYETEALPKDVDIQNKFGKYSVSYKMLSNRIEVIRKTETYANRFSPVEYNDLAAYFEQKYKSDRARIVLVKKEG